MALCAGWPWSPWRSGRQAGADRTPMAVVIIWGLASSTLLNMLVVPVLYYRFGRPDKMPPAQWP